MLRGPLPGNSRHHRYKKQKASVLVNMFQLSRSVVLPLPEKYLKKKKDKQDIWRGLNMEDYSI